MEENKKQQVIVIGGDKHPETLQRAMAEMGDEVELVTVDKLLGSKDLMESIDMLYRTQPYDFEMVKHGMDILYPPVPKSLRGKQVVPVRDSKVDPKIQRNDPCPCGSGNKYKRCCE